MTPLTPLVEAKAKSYSQLNKVPQLSLSGSVCISADEAERQGRCWSGCVTIFVCDRGSG
jgi:hypothetical protein